MKEWEATIYDYESVALPLSYVGFIVFYQDDLAVPLVFRLALIWHIQLSSCAGRGTYSWQTQAPSRKSELILRHRISAKHWPLLQFILGRRLIEMRPFPHDEHAAGKSIYEGLSTLDREEVVVAGHSLAQCSYLVLFMIHLRPSWRRESNSTVPIAPWNFEHNSIN